MNHPIQSGGSAIVNEGMIELLYGEQDWFSTRAIKKPEGSIPAEWLINNGHDALYLEVPEGRKDLAARILQDSMARRRKVGALLNYTAAAEIGHRWNEV